MGCQQSKEASFVEPEDKLTSQVSVVSQRNSQCLIDTEINDAQERSRQTDEDKVKLLLLGTGESGKSTIFKQFRILYGSAKTDDDMRMYGVVVRSNIITAVRKLCMLTRQLGFEKRLDEESAAACAVNREDICGMTVREAYDQIVSHLVDNTTTEPFPDISKEQSGKDWVGKSSLAGIQANVDARHFLQHVEAIRVLWQSNTMREVWMNRSKANINDSHKSFLSDLTRIASTSYRPTEADVLMSRVRTTQVTVERYVIEGIEFEVYDVGGQRSERRKWVDCFENVDAVIFVVALSEYDQTLAEAKRQNRMIEALNLFESVVKNAHFADTSIMLFLNKKDIFAEKILYSDIAHVQYFSDYAGPSKDFDHGVLYFVQRFEEHLEGDEFSDSFIHVTNATDTTNMEFVLDSSRTIIMAENLRRAGFLGSD